MVAEKIEVRTRSADSDTAYLWSSDGKSSYSVEQTEKSNRGTKITLLLSDTSSEFLQTWKIRELVKKYSNYIAVPIMMQEEE